MLLAVPSLVTAAAYAVAIPDVFGTGHAVQKTVGTSCTLSSKVQPGSVESESSAFHTADGAAPPIRDSWSARDDRSDMIKFAWVRFELGHSGNQTDGGNAKMHRWSNASCGF
jgi:hypothetical protein